MKQYLDVKNQHPGSIVLFRMGDFFETFNEDAKITANILGIVLTKRANGAASEVPLAGFPHHALDNYLPKLVKAGHRVAICEQVEDPKSAKGIVKRKVIEVVTPGTITADQALNEKSNSYIASVFSYHDNSGYAVLDQSTGEFFIGECSSNNLTECLRKFTPKEILIGENTAERLKMSVDSVVSKKGKKEFVMGRDLTTGTGKKVEITSVDIKNAMKHTVEILIDTIKDVLESTPPEILADALDNGIYLSGGGALLDNLSSFIEKETQFPVNIVSEPLLSVINGTGIILEDTNSYNTILRDEDEGPIQI